jgi:acyl carrier protein
MKKTEQLTQTIRELSLSTLGRTSITADDDFFDLGASSLTIVDLQLQLEAKLGITVPTSALMRSPSVRGWTDVYSAAVKETAPQ